VLCNHAPKQNSVNTLKHSSWHSICQKTRYHAKYRSDGSQLGNEFQSPGKSDKTAQDSPTIFNVYIRFIRKKTSVDKPLLEYMNKKLNTRWYW